MKGCGFFLRLVAFFANQTVLKKNKQTKYNDNIQFLSHTYNLQLWIPSICMQHIYDKFKILCVTINKTAVVVVVIENKYI